MTTILVAHSQRPMRETLTASMRGGGDARVIKASNGLDVLGIIGSREIDAVIVGADFADLDTGDLLGWIRANGPTGDLPVLVVETTRNRHARNAWIDAGATAVVTVPFAVDALRASVGRAIQARLHGAVRTAALAANAHRRTLHRS